MAALTDLGPVHYFPVADPSGLRAVGWLERGNAYATGEVTREFFDKLCQLLVSPFEPVASGGTHRCDLCQFSGGSGVLRFGDVEVTLGASNLFVPGDGCIYVAPSLVAHYIDAHRYRPPEEFVRAVLACPPTHSIEYKRLFLANGGRGLLRAPDAR